MHTTSHNPSVEGQRDQWPWNCRKQHHGWDWKEHSLKVFYKWCSNPSPPQATKQIHLLKHLISEAWPTGSRGKASLGRGEKGEDLTKSRVEHCVASPLTPALAAKIYKPPSRKREDYSPGKLTSPRRKNYRYSIEPHKTARWWSSPVDKLHLSWSVFTVLLLKIKSNQNWIAKFHQCLPKVSNIKGRGNISKRKKQGKKN